MTQQVRPSSTVPQSGRAAIYATVAPGARTRTTQPQTETLIELANLQGYPNERMIVYQDVGVSARRPIAMRGALRDLLTAILEETEPGSGQGKIQTVFVSSPHRLFRDPASVDIATFLHTCADHGVQIVTPDTTYDLTDPPKSPFSGLKRSNNPMQHRLPVTSHLPQDGLPLTGNVAVITLAIVYHFTNPLLERLFRPKCEVASLYLGEILNRMQIGRR